MKLSKKTLETIDNLNARMRLGIALNRSEDTIRRYIEANNIILTTAVALDFIRKETGLSENEIFEDKKEKDNAYCRSFSVWNSFIPLMTTCFDCIILSS